MTDANITVTAGDVTAMLTQRQLDRLTAAEGVLQAEHERLWRDLEALRGEIEAIARAKYEKLKPKLDGIAEGFRALAGSGRYGHRLALPTGEFATVQMFAVFLENGTRLPMPISGYAWKHIHIEVGWLQDGDIVDILPQRLGVVPVQLSKGRAQAAQVLLDRLNAVRQERADIADAIKDVATIERKARAAMTETLLARLDPQVLAEMDALLPSRRVIEAAP